MWRIDKSAALAVVITVALLSGSSAALRPGIALADPAKLAWSIVDTPAPGPPNNTILSPSEVSAFALASDDFTIYAADTPNGRTFKSTDGGNTWPVQQELGPKLGGVRVWSIAVAPDEPNFVAAITDNAGPKRVLISPDGGATWNDSNLTIGAAEYVSSIDISMRYSGDLGRDIAVGPRTGGGTGAVYALRVDSFLAGWSNQFLVPGGDVTALKFSPNYTSDLTIIVVYADALGGTFLTTGTHDVIANTTGWSGTQVEVKPMSSPPGSSPNAAQIVTADLELPSDFMGTNPANRRYYVSYDDVKITGNDGVYRIDDIMPYRINPPTTGRIASIAYWGTYAEGKLAAGEVLANPNLAMANVWRCSDPISTTPAWQKSDDQKSPTGGANYGFANPQLAWSFSGNRLYCGTSSADLTAGGTGLVPGRWPQALLTTNSLDESAFSVSPYSQTYEQDLLKAGKTLDTDIGKIWNQLSLIDTEISFLSDIAALDVPKDSTDYPVRYLATVSDNSTVAQSCDSVWRASSDVLGRTWERVLCVSSNATSPLLRVKPRSSDTAGSTAGSTADRSRCLALAGEGTTDVRYSPDEGQSWHRLYPGITVTDLSLASDTSMYILSGPNVRRGIMTGANWTWYAQIDTQLNTGHTIATPLKNPEKKKNEGEGLEDWVAVGSGDGYLAYADFSKIDVGFRPSPAQRVQVTLPGNMHVVFDDKFDENGIIYAATSDTVAGTSGKIYRWTVGKSTAWDELEPPNNAFYGICHGSDVLYGVWNTPAIPGILPGMDRTLYSRATVSPPIEWDDLTAGLPLPPNTVLFTREPAALKISTNDYNNLWAIDNRRYASANNIGCLWAYTDTMARKGPWSTAPASGDLILVDPVSGRAEEVNFAWDSLESATVYELQIAKDNNFNIQIFSSDNITPVDQTAPAVYFPAGGLSPTPASAVGNWGNLEAGHDYYWRVRASRAVTGGIIHSPWSAAMYFTVKIGVPTTAKHQGLKLLKPSNGSKNVSLSPSFSWTPFPKTTAYELIIARDPALSDYIVKTTASGTAYEYEEGMLEHGIAYYWQVRAIKPVPSDPSPVATFTTVAPDKVPQVDAPKKTRLPSWIWAVIGIYAVLITVLIVFASMKPAYFGPPPKSVNQPRPFAERPMNPFARIAESVSRRIRRGRYPDKPQERQAIEPETDVQPWQSAKPGHLVEKPGSSFSEKLKTPFDQLAETISPRIRERHYLEELEERGIIKPGPKPIEELPRENLLSRLKSAILSRFRRRQHPEDEGDFE